VGASAVVDKWVIADTHFGHHNIIKFTGPDGKVVRPHPEGRPFVDIEEHDNLIVQNWNAAVKPQDKVYLVGDIGKPLSILKRLNGHKRLILGNHDDIHDMRDLAENFEQVLASKIFRNDFAHPIIMCHFPLHANETISDGRRICVHGHIHEKIITRQGGFVDPWYVNVCAEHTGMALLSWDDLGKRVKQCHDGLLNLGELSHASR
jgi:calcineurin-like phosphoesterase family protein